MKNQALVIAALSLLVAGETVAANSIVYVDANGTAASPDGSSWQKAFSSLQDALDAAASTPGADDIWIAKGTYRPSRIYAPSGVLGGQFFVENPGPVPHNLKTFHLPDGVHLYGGFEPGARELSQRDPVANETVLDGDLAGNDPADKSDNAWHVLIAGNDVDQTGITGSIHALSVKNGNAAGPPTPLGFSNANFRYTHDYGGAMVINFNTRLLLEDMKFVGNRANADGGALFYNNSDVIVSRSHFQDNACGFRGGAIEAFSLEDEVGDQTGITNMLITGSTFVGNSAGVFGGAIVGEGTFASQDSRLTIAESYFAENFALEGGAVVIDSLNVLVDRTVFFRNTADANAGALAMTSVVEFLAGGTSLFTTRVSDSSFVQNFARGDNTALNAVFAGFGVNFSSGGGAVVTYLRGITEIEGSTFLGNGTLLGEGGAILNGDADFLGNVVTSVETRVTKSSFVGNWALDGGAVSSSSATGLAPDLFDGKQNLLDVTDSVFDRNTAAELGGALHLDGAVANVVGNLLKRRNSATTGSRIYANGSEVNGISSTSDPSDLETELISANIIHPLAAGDLMLE